MGLVLASCGKPSLVGTWVEPAAEGSLLGEVGFTLLENGEVKSINTGFREYKHWEQQGKKLIISGSISGSVPLIRKNDTMAIGKSFFFRRLWIKSAMTPRNKDCQRLKARSQKQNKEY